MYSFHCDCVSWPPEDVHSKGGLSDMVDTEIDITRRTFLKHVDKEDLAELARSLGYEEHHTRGLTMANDWCISYHGGILHGKRCYYFRHSSIEYVFLD